MASSPITLWHTGKQWKQWQTLFLGASKSHHCRWWLLSWNEKTFAPWKKSYDQLRQHIQKWRHHFTDKGPHSQSYGFSCSYVQIWELDHKEDRVLKNWCFWTVVLEKTWESLGQQGDQTSQSQRKSTINIHWKDWCWSCSSNTSATWYEELTHGKRPWCSKEWRQKEKEMTENEMAR